MPTFPDPCAPKQTTLAADAQLDLQDGRAKEGCKPRPSAASGNAEDAADALSEVARDPRSALDVPMTWSKSASVRGDKSALIDNGRNPARSQQTQGNPAGHDIGCPVVSLRNDPSRKENVINCQKAVSSFPSWDHPASSEEASAGKTLNRRRRRGVTSLLPAQSVSDEIKKKPANLVVRPVAWRRLREEEKFLLAAERCQSDGGVAVTLNLGAGRERSYMSHGHKTQVRRLFQNSLNKALKEAGLSGLEYAFLFEISPAGRLHLHGVLRGAGLDNTAVKAVKAALRQAAGKIHGRAAARQVKLKRLYGAAGWTKYTFKVRKATANRLGDDRLMVMSENMGRLLRVFHKETREIRRAA